METGIEKQLLSQWVDLCYAGIEQALYDEMRLKYEEAEELFAVDPVIFRNSFCYGVTRLAPEYQMPLLEIVRWYVIFEHSNKGYNTEHFTYMLGNAIADPTFLQFDHERSLQQHYPELFVRDVLVATHQELLSIGAIYVFKEYCSYERS